MTWTIRKEDNTRSKPNTAALNLSLASPAWLGMAPEVNHCIPPHTSIIKAAKPAIPTKK